MLRLAAYSLTTAWVWRQGTAIPKTPQPRAATSSPAMTQTTTARLDRRGPAAGAAVEGVKGALLGFIYTALGGAQAGSGLTGSMTTAVP